MDENLELPKRTPQHVIDSDACKIFEGKIPSEWRLESQNKTTEYGIDYTLEIFSSTSPTGKLIFVQLKGTTTLNEDDTPSIPLDKAHVNYYYFKFERPVFLVLVDTKTKQGWFVYLQEYFRLNYSVEDLSAQSSFTFSFDRNFEVGNKILLKEKIISACDSFAQLRLGIEEEWLKLLDNRVEARITLTSKGKQYHISPKSSFTLKLDVHSADRELLYKFLKGDEVAFPGKDFKLMGSSIFEKFIPVDGSAVLAKFGNENESNIILVFKDRRGREILAQPVEGILSKSLATRRFESKWKGSPLDVEESFESLPGSKPKTQLDIRFKSRAWHDINVLRLPYFEEIQGIVSALALQDGTMQLENFFEGQRMSLGKPVGNVNYDEWKTYLIWVERLRKIVRYFKLDGGIKSL